MKARERAIHMRSVVVKDLASAANSSTPVPSSTPIQIGSASVNLEIKESFDKTLNSPLRIATDCSGMEVPILALRKMGISHQHIFSCDNDPVVKQFVRENFTPDKLFDDVVNRDHSSIPPVDIYTA